MTIDYDAELMLRVGQDDSASFALLLDRHRPAVTRFIQRKIKNQALAEELSQEVFLRVYRSRHTYHATAKFRTWLFRNATHLALNAVRDSQKDAWHERLSDWPPSGGVWQISDGRPTIEERLLREVRLNEVRQAIADLPAVQRTAVMMQRYEEMDYGEIARTLDCSESAVKSLVFRAHETLRHRLAHMVPLESARGTAGALLRMAS